FILLLAAATVVSVAFSQQAQHEADQARRERGRAEKIATFMQNMLKGVGPSVALGRDTTMLREMLDAAAQRIHGGELKAAPEAELQLRLTTGDLYREIGRFDAAEEILGPVEEMARSLDGAKGAILANALSTIVFLLEAEDKASTALPKNEEALALYRRAYG